MVDAKYHIKGLVATIYECQKKIILNRRIIKDLEPYGQDVEPYKEENSSLEDQILEFQKELKLKYQFSHLEDLKQEKG